MTDISTAKRKKIARIFDGSPVNGNDRTWLLYELGLSQSQISEQLGVSQQAVNQVLNDKAMSYNIASYIAAKTMVPLCKLWSCGKYADREASPDERTPGRNRSSLSHQGQCSGISASCPSAASEEVA